jgi:hypothetical protein
MGVPDSLFREGDASVILADCRHRRDGGEGAERRQAASASLDEA